MPFYFDCVGTLLANNQSYPLVALSEFVHNEFQNAQPNFRLMGIICRTLGERPETQMAKIFHELLLHDANKTALQHFLRKIHKSPPRDIQFDLTQFACDLCRNELSENFVTSITDRESWLEQVVDIICLTSLLCCPSTHEKDFLQRQQDFQMKVATIQRCGITWCHSVVPKLITSPSLMLRLVKKVLFFEPPSSYSFCSSDTSEANLFGHVQNEMPVHEITTTRVALIGVDPTFRLVPEVYLDLITQLYYRAAKVQVRDATIPAMEVENASFVHKLLRLASVSAPNDPVNWVSCELFWNVCTLLVCTEKGKHKLIFCFYS